MYTQSTENSAGSTAQHPPSLSNSTTCVRISRVCVRAYECVLVFVYNCDFVQLSLLDHFNLRTYIYLACVCVRMYACLCACTIVLVEEKWVHIVHCTTYSYTLQATPLITQ